jgi:hypothetical protein
MLEEGAQGKTRNELVENYFCVRQPDGSPPKALDYVGTPIKWRSIASPIKWLLGDKKYQREGVPYLHESAYLVKCSVTGNDSKLLFPIHVNPEHSPRNPKTQTMSMQI